MSLPVRPRILVVRLSAIGDCVHSLPIVNAIRDAFPESYIAWLVEGRTGDLLDGHPAVDKVIRVRRKWLKSLTAVRALRRELRELRFDVTIDPQGLTKSALAAWLSAARRRIGFRGVDGRELSPWLNNKLVEPSAMHVIDRNLELLRPLGIEQPAVRFSLPETPADAQVAEACVHSMGLHGGYAVINPGAGWPSKVWSMERFAAVARHLADKHRLPSLVVWGGEAERVWAEEIVGGANGAALLAPSTTLRGLAAVVRRATIFVASDTGPLHIAAAVGTPCVGLFGPMPGERNGPYGVGHVTVQKIWLGGSSRQRRSADNASMLAISVNDACQACDQVLQTSRAEQQKSA